MLLVMNVKDRYMKIFQRKLEEYYLQVRDYDSKPEGDAQAIDAFMEAGLALEAVTKQELEIVIENTHQQIFGLSAQERRNNENRECLERQDYVKFEIPAWTRKTSRVKK